MKSYTRHLKTPTRGLYWSTLPLLIPRHLVVRLYHTYSPTRTVGRTTWISVKDWDDVKSGISTGSGLSFFPSSSEKFPSVCKSKRRDHGSVYPHYHGY